MREWGADTVVYTFAALITVSYKIWPLVRPADPEIESGPNLSFLKIFLYEKSSALDSFQGRERKMDKPLVHPNFAQPSSKRTSPSPTSPTSTATATTTTTTEPHKTTCNASTSTIQYDHETYLELLAGESNHVEKTASQVYEEVSPLPYPSHPFLQ